MARPAAGETIPHSELGRRGAAAPGGAQTGHTGAPGAGAAGGGDRKRRN